MISQITRIGNWKAKLATKSTGCSLASSSSTSSSAIRCAVGRQPFTRRTVNEPDTSRRTRWCRSGGMFARKSGSAVVASSPGKNVGAPA